MTHVKKQVMVACACNPGAGQAEMGSSWTFLASLIGELHVPVRESVLINKVGNSGEMILEVNIWIPRARTHMCMLIYTFVHLPPHTQ